MNTTKPSIGLAFITRTEADAQKVIKKYGQYFDEVFYEVGKVTDFAKARNKVLEKTTTDFWMWFDGDDEVEGIKNLRKLVDKMQAEGLDVMYLPYNYAINKLGESIAWHWRERIIRRSHPFQWYAPVHETLVTEGFPKSEKSEAIVIKHDKTQEEYQQSLERNVKILEKEYRRDKDPRITQYLANNYLGLGRIDEAIEKFYEHIETSGSEEHKYQSWLNIAECQWKTGHTMKAIQAAMNATHVLPSYPDAYFKLGKYYSELKEYHKAIQWIKVGFSKPEPSTLEISDPTERTYRPLMTAALCHFQIGEFREARALLYEVLEQSPRYPLALKIKDTIDEGYYESEAISRVRWLVKYLQDYKGSPDKLFDALPQHLRFDLRLSQQRREVFKPKVWPKKSIVIFCGHTFEQWGPDTLDTGMSGSEEAVVYLSRELTKLGWQVTVFNEREDEYKDGDVTYVPWASFNPEDTFDVFVAWRSPELLRTINARLKLCDLHDTIQPERVVAHAKFVDKYLVKSNYHRSLYKELPDDKIMVIGHGIDKGHFK